MALPSSASISCAIVTAVTRHPPCCRRSSASFSMACTVVRYYATAATTRLATRSRFVPPAASAAEAAVVAGRPHRTAGTSAQCSPDSGVPGTAECWRHCGRRRPQHRPAWQWAAQRMLPLRLRCPANGAAQPAAHCLPKCCCDRRACHARRRRQQCCDAFAEQQAIRMLRRHGAECNSLPDAAYPCVRRVRGQIWWEIGLKTHAKQRIN